MLDLKLIVVWIKVVKADVTILSARRKALARRMEGDGVDGTKVSFDGADLLLDHRVEETDLKLTDTSGGYCHLKENEITV